jgi:ZIP family zinc transporter
MNAEIVWLGFIASLVAGLATGFGALPVLFTKRVSDKLLDFMLGFAAACMQSPHSNDPTI